MNHQDLVRSLAGHLQDPERILFVEPNLNGWAMGGDYGSPDILVVNKSYSRFVRRIYEVKASTSDLTSDLRKEKWTRYLPICDRLTFAVGRDVDYEKHLRPLPVGIMVERENGTWRTVRAAPANLKAEPWLDNVWMALLFGRMGERRNSRLERMEAERARLIGAELDGLRMSAFEALREKARELAELQHNLDRRSEELDQRDKATEQDHYQRALKRVCERLNAWVYAPRSEQEILERWASQILRSAFDSAQKRLFEESQEVSA